MNHLLRPLFATLLASAVALLFLSAGTPTRSEPLPVRVKAVASVPDDEGKFTLRLACTPEVDLANNFALRVALVTGIDSVGVSDHELEPGTKRWRAGRTVDCEVQVAFPPDVELGDGEIVMVQIGFVEEGKNHARPPIDELGYANEEDELLEVLTLETPRFVGSTGRARLEATFAEARALEPPDAWRVLEKGLRAANSEATKERFRDGLTEVGTHPPARPSAVEDMIVAQRIRNEQTRYFRLIAGRMFDRGDLHGALRLLEVAGGALAQSVGEEVVGALGDEQRVTQRIDDIRARLLTELTPEEQARVDELLAEHGRTQELLDAAVGFAEGDTYPIALALLRKLRHVNGITLYDRAQARLDEVGERWLAATPPDQEGEVRATLEHPAWDRTVTVASHCFLYIGPEKLVEGLPAESKRRFDLAYVFLTDLFGRRPNPDGDRVTVYFKELWDFGGGTGGGKQINIGRADPAPRRAVRVDTGLLYHELTHCIDDTTPIHAGFREGLANLGAAFAFEMLDQDTDALHSFGRNLEQFRRYFLERDLPYWRIQNYGPSAGFFLHFVDTYAKRGRGGHDWSGLRRLFREYRDAPVRDGREPSVIRALAHYLDRAYGPKTFDDLVAFGFPLVEADRRLLDVELDAFESGTDLGLFEDRFADFPNSPLPRDVLARDMSRRARRHEQERAEEIRNAAGVVSDWKVIGPFFAQRADPGAHPFTPETEIDFSKKPASWRASRAELTQRTWQDPIPDHVPTDSHKNVTLFPTGWLEFDYRPYGDDNSAIYALTHVTVLESVDALAHLRADDDFVLYVNDRRIGSYRGRGWNGSSSYVSWRGPMTNVADAMKFPVRLEAGRNKVLVKIRNRGGTAGLITAFSRPDGSPLDFRTDPAEPEPVGARTPVEEPTWKRVTTIDHRSYKSKAKTTVGSFRTRNKAFFGEDTEGLVKWRIFTVRPGFPQDSPSNLLWLKPKLTEGLDALKLDLELASDAPPKLSLTFQGEGDDEGLSGWTLILVPSGADAVQARLERYDRLVYHSDPIKLPESADGRTVSLAVWDGWCTLTLDGEVLFDRLPFRPIPDRHRVGLATWGPGTEIRSLTLSRAR